MSGRPSFAKTAVLAACDAAGADGFTTCEAQALLPDLKAATVQTLLSRGVKCGILFSAGLFREKRYFALLSEAQQWDIDHDTAHETARRHRARCKEYNKSRRKPKAKAAKPPKPPRAPRAPKAHKPTSTVGQRVAAYLDAHPEGVTSAQAMADLAPLVRTTIFNHLSVRPAIVGHRRTRYFATVEAMEAAEPGVLAEWRDFDANRKDAAAERRRSRLRPNKYGATLSIPKSGLTPSRHVSVKGPGGTAQAPDMSRAKVTVWPTPPSRYAATGPVIGGFATMGVGRYLNTELLEG